MRIREYVRRMGGPAAEERFVSSHRFVMRVACVHDPDRIAVFLLVQIEYNL